MAAEPPSNTLSEAAIPPTSVPSPTIDAPATEAEMEKQSGTVEEKAVLVVTTAALDDLSSVSTQASIRDVERADSPDTLVEWAPSSREWLIMISLSIISLMVALDATILVAVLPTISSALNGTTVDALWAGTSYLLTSAVFQPVIASISEKFGRQQMLLFAITFFTVGSVLCAVATNFTVLLLGRCIQGVGGGGIITLSQVIFCDIVPLRQRPKYFALVLGAWAVGSIIGPVTGGALCQHTTWRWVFYINFPFCFLAFILATFIIKLEPVEQMTLKEKLVNIDWIGAVLFVGGMTSFLIGLSWGGVQYAWVSAQTLAPIIAGIVCVGAFIFFQRKVAPKSLIPVKLFWCRSAIAAFYCAMVNGFVLFSGLYYLPFYVMSVRGDSPTGSGINLFPALFFLLPGSVIVAGLTTRLGKFRWAIWTGWAITTLGAGLLILLDTKTSTAVRAVALAVFGIGTGMVLTSVNVAIQAISNEEDCAMASCMYAFMRSLGMPIGVALSGTIFQNAMSSKLSALGLPTAIAHDSERYVHVLRAMATADPQRVAIVEAYVHGFRGVFVLTTAASASALLVSLFIKRFSMDKALVNKYTAR